MPQYLVAIQHPENYDGSLEGEAMIREIGALNQEMDAAGARFFAGGLESASHAKSLRKQPDGNVFRRGSLPGLHYNDERPDRNSTSRRENSISGKFVVLAAASRNS
jgi:hypothetical protein